jgi:uncharacterized membrane protein YgdD (TMEM256/DUF423 family)
MPNRLWIFIGALLGLLSVAMAALLAHALPARLEEAQLALVRSALQMQGWHAIMLVLCGVLAPRWWLANLAAAAFLAGILLFSGGVYALAILGIHVPMIAPLGGTLLMLGWLLLGVSVLGRGNQGSVKD